jgi:DNA-binding transcriptional regulator YiaG
MTRGRDNSVSSDLVQLTIREWLSHREKWRGGSTVEGHEQNAATLWLAIRGNRTFTICRYGRPSPNFALSLSTMMATSKDRLATPMIFGVNSTEFVENNMADISKEQCRAARGWLELSQETLAGKANVSMSTVRDFEKGRHVPIANNLAALRRALEDWGIQFLFDPSEKPVGVAMSRFSRPQR